MQPNGNEPVQNWSYQPEERTQADDFQPSVPPTDERIEAVSWTGSEFLDRQKDFSWYIIFGLSLAVICAFIFLISKDLISIIFVAVIGVLFAIIASRKPKQLTYSISNQGISIGKRNYSFADFKSFSVQRDGAIGYINLMPIRRLAPELSIYYPPQEENKIFDALAQHIPHEQVKESLIDRAFKAFHF